MTSDEKWILYNNVEWKRLWGKWNEPSPPTPKASLHPKKAMLCVWWDWKRVLYYEIFLKKKTINSNKHCSLRPARSSTQWKAFRIHQQKMYNLPWGYHKTTCFFDDQAKTVKCVAGEFWLIHCIYPTLHLCISIYFGLYKILLMEKNLIPRKTAKGTWKSSLLEKIKRFGKVELWSCRKDGRRWWNKTVNTMFNKVIGENEKGVFYFYFKSEWTLWPTQYLLSHFYKCLWSGTIYYYASL